MMPTFKRIKYEVFKVIEFVHFFWGNSHGLSNIIEIHTEIQPKIFFKFKFIYFNWRLITLQYCIGSLIW